MSGCCLAWRRDCGDLPAGWPFKSAAAMPLPEMSAMTKARRFWRGRGSRNSRRRLGEPGCRTPEYSRGREREGLRNRRDCTCLRFQFVGGAAFGFLLCDDGAALRFHGVGSSSKLTSEKELPSISRNAQRFRPRSAFFAEGMPVPCWSWILRLDLQLRPLRRFAAG